MHRWLVGSLGLSMLALGGCVNVVAESARHIGCEENEITITNEDGPDPSQWDATCRNQTYRCTNDPGGRWGSIVSCTPKPR